MTKKRIYILGMITMLVFPIPALWALWFFKDISPLEVMDFGSLFQWQTLLGLAWGVIFAFISMKLLHNKWFDQELKKQEEMISSMHLNLFDKIFLSLCAGFGEEILFRSGMQTWAGIWITSIVFIAIHGYLNPKKPRLSLYGLMLMPFILSLGYALEPLGIWFCIAAHFAYDLVLFLYIDEEEDDKEIPIQEQAIFRIDEHFENDSFIIKKDESFFSS
jgi:membrane protease YdiL (CAAX protease family)